MVKFLKLLKNENKKELKKMSTKIFIFVAIFTVILAVVLVTFLKWLNDKGNEFISEDWKQNFSYTIDETKTNLKYAKEENDNITVINLEELLNIYNFVLDNDINLYSSYKDWKITVLQEYIDKAHASQLYLSVDENEKSMQKQELQKMLDLIKQDDFSSYINDQNDKLKEKLDKGLINKEQYDIEKEIIDLRQKYEIGKIGSENTAWKEVILSEIKTLRNDIYTNLDSYTRKAFTYEQKEEKENRIKIDLYRLENNIAPISSYIGEENYRSYFDSFAEGFSMLIVSVLIIMMAGGAIATEHSKGTIKFLVMTPNKRWKILLAKLVNIILIMVVTTIIISLVTILVGNVFFAGSKVSPYLYVQNGEVCELNHTVYTILRFLVDDIEILFYLLFALVLSTITRNTAASIGVSIATYLGNGIVVTLLNTFVKSDWLKFIPFNNFNLTDRIFTNTTTLMPAQVSDILGNIPVTFSLILLGVCGVLMIITAFDSFNKKDIK